MHFCLLSLYMYAYVILSLYNSICIGNSFFHFTRPVLSGSSLQAADGNDSQDHAALGPVVIMDIGDNIGGGSTADSTFLLQEAVAQVRSPKLTVAFSQSSYIVMTYRVVGSCRAQPASCRR